MPETYDSLRNKFFVGDNDGILRAEAILKDGGWGVEHGLITPPERINLDKHTRGEQIDARDYLLEEWDYGMLYPKEIIPKCEQSSFFLTDGSRCQRLIRDLRWYRIKDNRIVDHDRYRSDLIDRSGSHIAYKHHG